MGIWRTLQLISEPLHIPRTQPNVSMCPTGTNSDPGGTGTSAGTLARALTKRYNQLFVFDTAISRIPPTSINFWQGLLLA